MAPLQKSPPSWRSVLEDAAEHVNGGARSFPLASESRFIQHAYDPPNEAYQKLFFRQATVPNSQTKSLFCGASAGWLIPDDGSTCRPVFIAHSLLSAIWLIRKSLPPYTLSDDAWGELVAAAQSLAEEAAEDDSEEDVPPSAQKATLASSKRRAVSTQNTPSAKRARTESQSQTQAAQRPPRSASPVPSDVSTGDLSLLEEPVYTRTVTNNNRRAERDRAKRAVKNAEQKLLDHGLLAPSESADRNERAAYSSVEAKDAPSISWVFKQDAGGGLDLYHRSKSPYATATRMLRNARSLGNASAQENAAVFLQRWRETGTPFSPGQARSENLPATQLVSQSQANTAATTIDKEFFYTYNLVSHYEKRLATVHVEYRWALAFLGRTYANKVAALQEEDERAGRGPLQTRNGKGKVRSEALDSLVKLLYPNLTPVPIPLRRTLKNLLQRATRWYKAATTLGWGALCLMPHDMVANTWAEKTLTVGEWDIWLQLVIQVNPNAHNASRALDDWLGLDGIAGKSITDKKTLCIEAEAPEALRQIEEVADSDDDASEVEGGDGTPVDTTQKDKSPTPARSLRQTSLLDLFRPVG
jgi:hypothetical protein